MENGKLKMENWGRRAVVLLLALCMAVSLVPMSATAAVSGQDAYYLERLAPKSMPRATESYPAKLILTSAMPFDSPVTLELKGTLGLNAELTDEEIVAILKQAVSAVKSYTSPQSACDDLVLVCRAGVRLWTACLSALRNIRKTSRNIRTSSSCHRQTSG